MSNKQNFKMYFAAVAIVLAIVLGQSFKQRVDFWLAEISMFFVLITVARSTSTYVAHSAQNDRNINKKRRNISVKTAIV